MVEAHEKRLDIEALRGIAVLAVLAYHIAPKWLPGGLLGVDVFFVISGFVITRSLTVRKSGAFIDDLVHFYVRRIKRLLPALVLCILVCSAVILVMQLDNYAEMASLYVSLDTGLAALFAVANFSLYFDAVDYFSPSAELNAFTHTWSLGIEEQYYLIYPALFLLLARNSLYWLVLTLVAGSFILFFTAPPQFSFYMLPTRFWELGVGCLLCLLGLRLIRVSVWLAAMVVLLLALFIPAEQTRVGALAAVLATSVAIVSFEDRKLLHGLVTPLAWVGAISYSLYLWHWPVVVLFRYTVGVGFETFGQILALSFALACGSFYLIEQPLRRRSWGNPLRAFGYGAAGVVFAACVIISTSLLTVKKVNESRTYTGSAQGFSISGPYCHMPRHSDRLAACLTPGARPTLFVMGDSHARSLIPGLDRAYPDHDIRYLTDQALSWDLAGLEGCGRFDLGDCYADELGARIAFLSEHARPYDLVVVSLTRDLLYDGALFPERTPVPERLSALRSNLTRLTIGLRELGLPLLLVEDVPKICDSEGYVVSLSDRISCTVSARMSLNDREALSDIYSDLVRHGVRVVDPHDKLCPGEVCSNWTSGKLLYSDASSHLTLETSLDLAPLLAE